MNLCIPVMTRRMAEFHTNQFSMIRHSISIMTVTGHVMICVLKPRATQMFRLQIAETGFDSMSIAIILAKTKQESDYTPESWSKRQHQPSKTLPIQTKTERFPHRMHLPY